MAERIIVIDKVEPITDKEGNVIGRLITDKAGEQVKVKKGQGDSLLMRWGELDDATGKAYKFIMGEYKGFPFVQDFESVKGIFKQEAIKEVVQANADNKQVSIEKQVALKCGTEIQVALIAQDPKYKPALFWFDLELMYGWLKGDVLKETPVPPQPIAIPAKPSIPTPILTTQPTLPVPKGITDEQLVALTDVVKKGIKLSTYWKKYGWTIAKVKDLTHDQAARLIGDILEDLAVEDLKN